MIQYKNETGTVLFDPQVFAMIAMDTAVQKEEIYAVTNSRGKVIRQKETGKESLNFIEVLPSEESYSVDLRIYVVLNFGKSISATADEFGRLLRERIRMITGVSVGDLTMVGTGVRSRKIARRDLEIQC